MLNYTNIIKTWRDLRANLKINRIHESLNLRLNLRFFSPPRSSSRAAYWRADASHAKVTVVLCPRYAFTACKDTRPDAAAYEEEHQEGNDGNRQNCRPDVTAVTPAVDSVVHSAVDCANTLIIIVGFISANITCLNRIRFKVQRSTYGHWWLYCW